MNIIQQSQILVFLYSLVVGVVFAVIYDIFKIIRYINITNKKVTFISDVIYMLLCAILYFYFSVGFNQGYVRVFTMIGVIVGFFIYVYTIGKITDKLILYTSKKIISFFNIVKQLIKKLLKINK